MKALQIYSNDNGEPGELLQGDSLDLGVYDISIGMDKMIFLHNPNHNIIADISKWGTENRNSTLIHPDTILPLETVKVHVKVAGLSEEEIDGKEFEEDYVDSFGGHISFDACTISYEDSQRTYGWSDYHE